MKPHNPDQTPEPLEAIPAASAAEPRKIRVMVVDDSEVFLEAALSILECEPRINIVGHSSSAEDALAKVAELKPDLVIADLRMPNVSGLDLTRALKAGPQAPKVVVVSFYSGSEERDGAWYAGADAFVPKPQFVGRMATLLDQLFPR
jgi:DNA-binding NarL/FixJ family response regulator